MEENGSFSQALEEVGCFPASMTAYVKTGEETGCLDEIMNSLSEQYSEKSLNLISQAVSIVEPTIVILLSLLVGLVLLSVMMPLLGILSDFTM